MYAETFEINKKVYVIWDNKILNQGFGDKLRGSVTVYQLSKKLKFDMEVEINNEIGMFLKNAKSSAHEIIKTLPATEIIVDKEIIVNKVPRWAASEIVTNYITNEKDKKCLFMATNSIPEDMSEDDKRFLRRLLVPNDRFVPEIDKATQQLPKNYTILHFRLGDNELHGRKNNEQKYETYLTMIQNKYSPTDVLVTDSTAFKKYVKDRVNIPTILCDGGDCKIFHTGESAFDYDSLKNSLIEFYVMTRAKKITTHSVYDWPSNFVKWSSDVYNVPLESVKL
jgi:hypothetical protein